MGFSDVRASFLTWTAPSYGKKTFAPERITASWEALYRQSHWIRSDQLTVAIPSTHWERVFTLTAAIKHYLNPLHIYCRLRNFGIGKRAAAFLCRFYERAIFKYLLERD